MNWKRMLAGVGVLGMMACGGGGGDSGTNPTNRAPEVAFTFAPLATAKSVPVDLTITASDEDGDPLTINWTVTRGTLTAQNSKKTIMRWTTPSTVGVDTVSVSVGDGTTTKKVTGQIHVGTPYVGGSFLAASSPYILTRSAVDPRVAIAEGATLTIEAGTEIYVNTTSLFFDVNGTLNAHGTSDAPIIIRYNDRTLLCGTSSGAWAGIRGGGNTGVVDLEYVELWYAQYGVRLKEEAVANLQNVSVRCSGSAGALIEGSSYLRAIDSEFTDGVGDGISITTQLTEPDSVRINGCILSFNNGSGIHMDLNDTNKSVPIFVDSNDIQFNSTHGISLAHSVFPSIHNNNFQGNGTDGISNLFLQGGYPGVAHPCLDATCNFWGNTSQNAIDIGIWDSLDQNTVDTRVKSCPWLNSNPLTSTPNCSTANCVSCP